MGFVEGDKRHTTRPNGLSDGQRVVGSGSPKTGASSVSFVDCTTVVDDGVCNIPDIRFCPFYIRGKNMAGLCRYYRGNIERCNKEKA